MSGSRRTFPFALAMFALLHTVIPASPRVETEEESEHGIPPGPFQILLREPSPEPDWEALARRRAERLPENLRPLPDGRFPDDAPIEILISFWSDPPWNPETKETLVMSLATCERILAYCREHPEFLARVDRNGFGMWEEATAFAQQCFEDETIRERMSESWRSEIRDWLIDEGMLLDTLEEMVRAVRDHGTRTYGSLLFHKLATRDFERARPILEAHAAGDQPETAFQAIEILLEQDRIPSETLLSGPRLARLQEIMYTHGYLRDSVIRLLLAHEWEGRQGWYRDLFSVPSMRSYLPLPVGKSDPDPFLEIVLELTDHGNPTVRDSAWHCLFSLATNYDIEEARHLVLPKIEDPDWIVRMNLTTYQVGILKPEVWFTYLEALDMEGKEPDQSSRRMVGALYRDPAWRPRLRELLDSREWGWPLSREVASEWIQAPGEIDDGERVLDDLVFYADTMKTPEGRERIRRIQEGRTVDIDIDATLRLFETEQQHRWMMGIREREREWQGWAEQGLWLDEIIRQISDHAERVRSDDPGLADCLTQMIDVWECGGDFPAFLDALSKPNDRETSTWEIRKFLELRDAVRKRHADRLRAAIEDGGEIAGFAAVILETESVHDILQGKDTLAQYACLSCARAVLDPIPLDLLEPLIEKGGLEHAVRAYLIALDSPEARNLLARYDRDRCPITGWGADSYYFEPMAGTVLELHERVLESESPIEIHALLSSGTWEGDGDWIVTLTDGSAHLEYRDRVGTNRPLTEAERDDFVTFFRERRIDELPAMETGTVDGVHYVYLHLTRERGRQIYMNNPGWEHGALAMDYVMLVEKFMRLTDRTPD